MGLDFDILEVPLQTNINPVDYQYFHQLMDNRTIIFNTEANEEIIERVYLPLKDFEEDDSTSPVTLIMNSPGGSVSDSFFLAYYLATYKKPLTVIIPGYAASMATVILCGGGKNPNVTRVCYPSSYALIHDGYVALSSSEAKTAEDIMAFNKSVDGQIRNFIIENTNITPELFDSKTRHQWFINATEMKELGLIDKIIGSDD